MFEIRLEHIGRRFNRDWIFRGMDYSFASGNRYAVLGSNGSGKSTLLKVISGSLSTSEGQLHYQMDKQDVPDDQVYRHISIAAPYVELIEEFSLQEQIDFHFQFKEYLPGYDRQQLTALIGLQSSMHKPLRFFSSGMKQRVKLALACCSETEVLLLDEPTSNLDDQAVEWYHHLLEETVRQRVLIICSNQKEEYKTCNFQLHITDYKE